MRALPEARGSAIRRVVLSLIACLIAPMIRAATVTVTVLDRDGRPIPDVAVYLQPSDRIPRRAAPGTVAVMDQIDKRFVPHILVVETGTSVEFPNSDTVAHHVYSFSHPNQFKLPIYKGDVHPPVTFVESGLVILGCNIHDNMLGYILVVDTPAFARTDREGEVKLDTLGTGSPTVTAWSPRFRDPPESLSVTLALAADEDARLTIQAYEALRPPHDQQSESLSWTDY